MQLTNVWYRYIVESELGLFVKALSFDRLSTTRRGLCGSLKTQKYAKKDGICQNTGLY